VADDSKSTFNTFLGKTFSGKVKEICTITITGAGQNQIYTLLSGILSENGQFCMVTAVDITLQKKEELLSVQREQRLRKAENRRLAILETAMDGYWLLDRHGRLLEVNETYCRMSGYTIRELLAMSISDLEASEATDAILAHIEKIVRQGEDRFETRHRRKDGSLFDLEISAQYHPVEGGQFVAFLHDITVRKEAEEALKISEEKFKNLVWDMQVGVLLQGPHAEILLSNPQALELLGLDEDQLLGKTSFDPDWNVIHEDGSPFPGPEHPVPQAIATGKSVRSVVMGVYRPSGRDRVWLLVHAEPQFNIDTTLRNVVCTFIDISKRKHTEDALKQLNEELEDRVLERTSELQKSNDALRQTEEKYRTVADFTHDWEFWIDQNGIMLYSSPSSRRITGHDASSFMENPKLLYEIVHPLDEALFLSHKKSELSKRESNSEIQYRILRADGTTRWIGHVCQPVYSKSGKFLGIRGSNRDITESKNLEQLLRTSEQKYKLLSENISDGVFISRRGRLEYVNSAMNRLFGYEDNQLVGTMLNDLAHPQYCKEFENHLLIEFPFNQIRNIEIECYRKDQSTIFVDFLSHYVANEKVIYGVAHNISERRPLQKNILNAIIQTEENERTHFSRELHDGLGPLLSLTKLLIQSSQRPKSDKSREEIIRKAEQMVDDSLAAVKEISNRLNPHILTNYGVSSAIQNFVDKYAESSAFNIAFQSNTARRFTPEIEATLYRVLIECINNTARHANANNVDIRMHDSGYQVLINYKDDGIGFNIPDAWLVLKGFGLFNLQSRIEHIGGTISLSSTPGHGVDYQILINC
jgi:PAS domain S-box-containing protein